MEDKICVICGKQFTPRNKSQECCSSLCGNKKMGITQRHYRICLDCGCEFWHQNGRNHKYCSEECRVSARKKRKKPVVIKEPVEKNCLYCGSKFTTVYPNKKYCSHDCASSNSKMLGRLKWAEEFVPKSFFCKECGTEFVTECGKPRSVFCCKECSDKYERRVEHYTERHKSYMKDFRSKRDRQLRKAFVEEVRYENIYKRDSGMCQICGLPVHPVKGIDNNWDGTIDHIVPLSVGGKHSMDNCQLAHRICNSIKCKEGRDFHIDWNEKAKESNYWMNKLNCYTYLMAKGDQISV